MIVNIIFDFGGVLYDIDYELTARKLSELSTIKKDVVSLDEMLEIPDLFERGKISENLFRETLKQSFGIYNLSDQEIDNVWNSMLLRLKPDAIDFIKEINKNYSTALLSNTNAIHYRKFHKETLNLENEFQYTFFSHLIGMRKPDIEIYNYVCNYCGFKQEETLFIDDNYINVKGAILANLKGYQCKRNGQLSELFNTIKNITHTY